MRHFGIDHVASNYLVTYNVNGEQLRESLETVSNAAKHLIDVIGGNQQNTEASKTMTSPDGEEVAA